MEIEIKKQITVDFLCLIENPEELLKENIDWEKVKGNDKTIDALWEFYLAGCEIILKSNFDETGVSNFLDKNSLWETGIKIKK